MVQDLIQDPSLLLEILRYFGQNELRAIAILNSKFNLYSKKVLLEQEDEQNMDRDSANLNWLNRFIANVRTGHLRYANDLFKIIAPTPVLLRGDLSAELKLKMTILMMNQFPFLKISPELYQKIGNFTSFTLTIPQLRPLTLVLLIRFFNKNPKALENTDLFIEALILDLQQGLNHPELDIQIKTLEALDFLFQDIKNSEEKIQAIDSVLGVINDLTLDQALEEGNSDLGCEVIRTLDAVSKNTKDPDLHQVNSLMLLLSDPDWRVRGKATETIVPMFKATNNLEIHHVLATSLKERLADRHWTVKQEAVLTLASIFQDIRDPELRQDLVDSLNNPLSDNVSDVIRVALETLGSVFKRTNNLKLSPALAKSLKEKLLASDPFTPGVAMQTIFYVLKATKDLKLREDLANDLRKMLGIEEWAGQAINIISDLFLEGVFPDECLNLPSEPVINAFKSYLDQKNQGNKSDELKTSQSLSASL